MPEPAPEYGEPFDGEASAAGSDTHAPEKIRALRAAIDAKLHEQGIYEQIRELVRAKTKSATSTPHAADNDAADVDGGTLEDRTELQSEQETHLIHDVLESEVVKQLLATMRSTNLSISDKGRPATTTDTATDTPPEPENDRDVYLYLRLAGGKAFVDQLVELDEGPGGLEDAENSPSSSLNASKCPVGSVLSFFRVIASFQRQRQVSRDVQCSVDPQFDEHFRFRVNKQRVRSARTRGGAAYTVDVTSPWEALCLVQEAVQLDVIKLTKKLLHRDAQGREQWRELSCEMLAVHRLDWRRVLCSTLQLVHFPVQLTGRMKESVGALDIRADLLNCKRSSNIAREARAFLNQEALQRNATNHAFYKYAKQWWDEYRSETRDAKPHTTPDTATATDDDEYSQLLAHIGARPRLVKLFAEDEEGRYRMVCKFLTPVRAPEAVRGPSEAARFVGLLPFESNALVGGARDETWRSLASVLSLGRGDAQDHAVLLASLLLGCGLDAYVCIGTISASKSASRFKRNVQQRDRQHRSAATEVGHIWVLTRGAHSTDVTLWEAVTGDKFSLQDARGPRSRGYCAIDCIFNHRQLFANLQPRNWPLADYSFDLEDESAWKRIDEQLVADLPLAQPSVHLLPPDASGASHQEREWTTQLKHEISCRRRADGLVTHWSDELSYYLLPALASYELERLYGVAQVDNGFFQQSVTGFVQEGHTFQGVPCMFTVESVEQAMASMTENALAAEILTLHARATQFALAVRCFPYAERTCAVWVMLAVSYQSVT